MKVWLILRLAAMVLAATLLSSAALQAAPAVTELSLLDGSRIKGRVLSLTTSEATVMTDFGIVRIALEKLAVETRAALTQQAGQPDVETLQRRVAELEAQVAQLQRENESLRRASRAQISPGTSGVSSGGGYPPSSGSNPLLITPQQSMTPSAAPATAGGRFSLSSTGKRHNAGCRYFGSGRACGATDGVACKICGG